jgi:hypothetical protein
VIAFSENAGIKKFLSHPDSGISADEITNMMNRWISIYGCYSLSMVLDPNGRVILVNTKKRDGTPIQVKFLNNMSFAHEPWFQKGLIDDFKREVDG